MNTGENNESIAQHISRLTDIADEPLEFIAPIGGYGKEPLVTLEKTIETLESILPSVVSHAYIAKKRFRTPADGLTPDESAAIMLYTMSWEPIDECLYFALNSTLRASNRQQKLKPWYLFMQLFLNALLRLKPTKMTVYRGVKLDLIECYVIGETLVWWGFSSCTKLVHVLESDLFLGEQGPRTMFIFQYESGRSIAHHSYFDIEDEVLLLPGTQFYVQGCFRQSDLNIIQLTENLPSVPLLELINTDNSS